MRVIKFRTFDEMTGKMVPVGEINSRLSINGNGTLNSLSVFGEGPVMQYIGIDDINHVEIYEGDIVDILDVDHKEVVARGEVFYKRNEFRHTYNEIEDGELTGESRPSKAMFNSCIVIGNIYENTDLARS